MSQRRPNDSPAPITNLTAQDFRVSAPGKSLVRSAEFHAQPATVVPAGRRRESKSGLEIAIADRPRSGALLSPDVELDLIIFSNQVEQKFSFQKDRQSFVAALSRLGQAGNRSSEKGLLAAVNEGFAALNPPHASDAEIFLSAAPLIGDREKRERRKLEQLLSPSGVRLFGVPFAGPNLTINGQKVFGVPLHPAQVDEFSEALTSCEVLAYDTGRHGVPIFRAETYIH